MLFLFVIEGISVKSMSDAPGFLSDLPLLKH